MNAHIYERIAARLRVGGREIRPGDAQIEDGLPVGLVFGVEQGERFRFVLRAEAELLAGGGVLVIENTRTPEQDKTRFHDNAFLGHES